MSKRKALACGCIPHITRMSHFGTAVYCETEQNAYCNFECPHYAEAFGFECAEFDADGTCIHSDHMMKAGF